MSFDVKVNVTCLECGIKFRAIVDSSDVLRDGEGMGFRRDRRVELRLVDDAPGHPCGNERLAVTFANIREILLEDLDSVMALAQRTKMDKIRGQGSLMF